MSNRVAIAAMTPHASQGSMALPSTNNAAGRACNDANRIAELRAEEREHVLNHQLRRVSRLAVFVPVIVETDHAPSLGKKTFRPATQTAKKVNAERA